MRYGERWSGSTCLANCGSNSTKLPFTDRSSCCGAARRTFRSLYALNLWSGELTVCGRSCLLTTENKSPLIEPVGHLIA